MVTESEVASANKTGFLAVALCCLAAVCEGMDLQLPGVSAPVLTSVFSMSPDQTGLFFSMSTFGMMLGALIGGRLSDSIGRKWALIGSIVIYSIFTLLTVLSTNIEMLWLLRFLTGIGLGGALPNLVALAVESVSLERRSAAVGLMLAGPGIGGALAGSIAAIFPEQDQWQALYYAGGLLPLLIVVPLLVIFLPNTTQSSKDSLSKVDASAPDIKTILFGKGQALRTLAVWLGLSSILLVLYVLLSWLPTLLVDRGLSRQEASMVQVMFNILGIPGSILAGVILDYLLKRRMIFTLAIVFVVAMIAIVILAKGPASMVVMLFGSALAGITIIGSQTIIYALAPISYPRSGRGTGVGFGVAAGRFGSAAGPLITGFLVAFGLTSSNVLMLLLPVVILSALVAMYIANSVSGQKDSG